MKTMCLHAARYTLLVMAACAVAPMLRAQESPFAPTSIGQLVNEVLQALVPPDKLISRVSVARRGIVFDYARTIAAFRNAGAPETSPSDLAVRAEVTQGGESVLDDCDQMGTRSCQRLGWSAYVWIEPISVTATEAVVRAHLSWPDRGRASFEEGVAPTGRAALTGYSAEVYLIRHADGGWRFNKLGRTIAGD